MNIRNLKHTASGSIDCEYEHPQYGWIPFTASKDDPEELGRLIYADAIAGLFGDITAIQVVVIDPVAVQAQIVKATQARLDAFAQTRNYDSILSACTYATSSIPRFAAEGQAAVDVRDATWAALYTLMGEVLAGTRPMPASFADVEPSLPALEWPV